MKEVIGTAIKCIFIVSVPCWLALAMDYANYKSWGEHVAIVDWFQVQSFATENAMSIQTWINNGDNLLTLLGTLAGLILSGGFWTWRKGAAFQRGFANGWNQRSGIQLPRETEYQDMEQKYDSLLYDHTNNLMLLGIARKDIQAFQDRYAKLAAELIEVKEAKETYEKQIDDLNKNITNSAFVYADQQQRIAHLSKDRDEWKAQYDSTTTCLNEKIQELHTKIKQAEENHLQSYGPAKEAGKEEGRQELAAKIVEHLLATEQASYVLNQKTGAVTLTMKQVGQLSPVLSNLIIALSGYMTPKKTLAWDKGKVDSGPFSGFIMSDQVGEVTGTFTTADPQYAKLLSAMQQTVPPKKTEKKAELCIYCKKEPVNHGFVLEYRGLCDDCGNGYGMDLKRLFTSVTNCCFDEWQAFLDMPIGVFIDKFGPLKDKYNQPLLSKRDGQPAWVSTFTVRGYIQSYGMFKKG